MFGHLKPEEFTNAIDGRIPAPRRAHLDACAVCAAELRSIESIRAGLTTGDTIPEPEWTEFRASIRTELLSRSVKRESTVRRWTGFPMRPAMAWSFSLVLLVCIGAGAFLWHVQDDMKRIGPQAAQETSPFEQHTLTLYVPVADKEATLAAWNHSRVFEELSNLGEGQAERLRVLLLRSAQKGNSD